MKQKMTICSNKTHSRTVLDKGAEMSPQEIRQAFHCNTRQQYFSAKNFLHAERITAPLQLSCLQPTRIYGAVALP